MRNIGNGSKGDGLSFDPASGELTGPVGVARLAPQPADLLVLLATRSGEVVTRDEIRDRLWPGGRVEFEQGIAFAIREVRRGLEAAGGDPGLVETIPKRGFRLHGRLPMTGRSDPEGGTSDSSLGGPPAPATGRAPEAGLAASGGVAVREVRERRATVPRLISGLGSAMAAGAVLFLSLRAGVSDPEPVLAIFPYDVGDATAAAPFSASLAEELTTALTLSYRGRIGVVGPTGTAAIAGPEDTDAARGELGACLVLSGSVRPLGPASLVVFTQIVRTSDLVHVWAARDTLDGPTDADSLVAEVIAGVGASIAGC